ncbi:GNAT family N-acetyltransferase [Actinoallomurus rhizosphaericola]|uniref:GNAT family N-acetyltransferase n=1 Tax=Actinoallomurus rhizosphaericola TaxID=2952536 RepID=UPI0020928CA5|nr:GNAT family N-acetyltransferase [Actinoallomurus rhizosphaericola]MCO5998887.1 GNAT family N-acetyltransferase [Actinoallomurus rhizosphaericola]
MTHTPAEPRRYRLDAMLSRPPVPADESFRTPTRADLPLLGALMWDAYRGTPDERDAGDGVASATEEIRLTFDGEHGPFVPEASFVAEEDGRLVAAALVTVWRGTPLLAFVFTASSHTGRGLARRLIRAAMGALAELGYDRLSLAVTEDNARARTLYESMGFAPV